MTVRSGLIIVVFNISHLIETQIKLIRRFNKDSNLEIVVIDNSSDPTMAKQIEGIVVNLGVKYIKANFHTTDFSKSHAEACNFAYKMFMHTYHYMMFLDHDNFPVEDFSIEQTLLYKYFAGVGQARRDKYYFWPGCVFVNNTKVERNLVDFQTNSRLSLDTGGNLYKLIEKYGQDQCVHFDQFDIPNPHFDGWHYNLIKNQKDAPFTLGFMHFINGSNWNHHDRNSERINSLMEILKSYVGEI